MSLKPPPKGLRGLQRVCRLHGSMTCGEHRYVWDYAAEEAVPEKDMKLGSKRWKASERSRYGAPANDKVSYHADSERGAHGKDTNDK